MCIQNLKTLALIEAKKFVTENLLGGKDKWTNKGNDKQQASSMLILFYTIQQVIPNFCTKFQNPWHSSSLDIFDTNFSMYCIWVREGKMEKEAKVNHSIFVFFPTIYLAPLKVYTKFEDSGCNTSWEFYDKTFYWRERKMDK